VTYRVRHRTEYAYDQPVTVSYGEMHLLPREVDGQVCHSTVITIEPTPDDYRERTDFFGNRVAHFSIFEPHDRLTVTATSVVDVRGRQSMLPLVADRPWETVRDATASGADAEALDARQYRLPSPNAPVTAAIAEFAAASFPPGRGLLDASADLMSRIGAFEFSPGATSVTTTVDEVLAARAGVCQDFAHVAIASLRAMGLAARYVSGYLETEPPPGSERLVGADVSHAWASVFVPEAGWVDLDPTNDQFVNDRYVTVGWGRDYGDVPPLKGVIFTEAEQHELTVTVDVVPLSPQGS